MKIKDRSLGVLFGGVGGLAFLQMLFYNWVGNGVPTPTLTVSVISSLRWLVTGVGFLGFYGVGRTLAHEFPRHLPGALLAIFSGAVIGCTLGIEALVRIESIRFSAFVSRWPLYSSNLIQIPFMAITAISLAHFRLIRRELRRRGIELDAKGQPLRALFVGVMVLGILKEGGHFWVLKQLEQASPGEARILLLLFWGGIMGLVIAYYGVGHRLRLNIPIILPRVILTIFSGAYGGTALFTVLIVISFSVGSGFWRLGSPWFLQNFFLAFAIISMARLLSK
jgi:hypothetical protein